jgi:hypothetical protein
MSELHTQSINPLEKEFKKYIKILDIPETLRWLTIKSIDIEGYGELAICGIDFGWFRIIKFNHEYDVATIIMPGTMKRKGFRHEILILKTTGDGFNEPVDIEEVFVEEKETGFQSFLTVMRHMMEEYLNEALMVESFAEQEEVQDPHKTFPYAVNFTWGSEGLKEQFLCEAQNIEHAKILTKLAHPGSVILEVKELGEE